MINKLLIRFSIIPYKQIKRENGVIYNYYRNDVVKLTICTGFDCDKCKCNM